MSLPTGARLGSFEVVGKLGAGGMGEVYRATDTKLHRQVALKILPQAFVADAERKARFEREARTLAALSHPNIAAIYGVEEDALVMEFVDGDDLSAIVARGAVPLDDALAIAAQIALALGAAHEQGIIHRDLKPANVKVRGDGVVKVLDCGLAKALDPPAASSTGILSNSPTITSPATELGLILGTAAYMSPEQARGKVVDRRADVWAFGVVLYEMLTGRRAFTGNEVTDVLASVIKDPVPLDALPPETPSSIRRLLRRCLEKDRDHRLDSMTTARLEIAEARANTGEAMVPATKPAAGSRLPVFAAVAIGAALLGGAGAAAWLRPRPTAPLPVTVVTVPPIGAATLGVNLNQPDLAISPDGRQLVYGDANVEGATLVVRSLDRAGDTPLPNLGMMPRSAFFSPDGRWMGYYSSESSGAGGRLMKVLTAGGVPVPIASFAQNMRGAAWAEDGTIYFAGVSPQTGLLRVSAEGGAIETLSAPAGDEVDHLWPSLLPGGTHLLFVIARRDNETGSALWDIAALEIATRKTTIVRRAGSFPRYLPTGHLVFASASGLMGIRFDPQTLATSGDAVALIPDLLFKITSGAADFAVSDTGTAAFVSGTFAEGRTLTWTDLDGRQTPLAAPSRPYGDLAIAPDGKRVACVIDDALSPSIWIYDLARATPMRLTPPDMPALGPVWSADGREIFFRAIAGRQGVYRVPAAGTGPPVLVRADAEDETLQPTGLVPGGDALLVTHSSRTVQANIRTLSLTGSPTLTPLLAENARVSGGRISPDGRWLAYVSADSSSGEIFLRPYPGVSSDRIKVSPTSGRAPRWSRSGRTLYYRSMDGSGRFLGVDVGDTASAISAPRELRVADAASLTLAYDVATSDKVDRLLAVRRLSDQSSKAELRLIFNWFEDVRARFGAR